MMSDPAQGLTTRAFIWEQGTLPGDVAINTTSTNIFTGTFTMAPQGSNYVVLLLATVQIASTAAAAQSVRVFLGLPGTTTEVDAAIPSTVTNFALTGHLLQSVAPGAVVAYSVTAVASVAATFTAKQFGLSGSTAACRVTFIAMPGPVPL